MNKIKNINKILITILIFFLIILLIVLFLKLKKYNNLYNQYIISNQNLNYQIDKNKVLYDSLIKISLYTDNLNKKLKNKDKLINLINSKYKLLLDSINIYYNNAISNVNDTLIIVNFSGKQKIFNYNGQTLYFIKTKESKYNLSINVDKLNIESYIFYDKNDKVIKNLIKVNPNVLIIDANSIIDNELLLLINKNINNISNISNDINKYNKKYKLYIGTGFNFDFINNISISPEIGLVYNEKNIFFVSTDLNKSFSNKKIFLTLGYKFVIF